MTPHLNHLAEMVQMRDHNIWFLLDKENYPPLIIKKSFLSLSLVSLQVIIQGFRSYRDQTVVEPFSSKHNVIGKF